MEYKNWEKKWMFRAENAGYPILGSVILLLLFPSIFTALLTMFGFGFMIRFGGFGYSEIL